MRRGFFAVAVLASAILTACPKPPPGARDAGAQDAGPRPGKPDCAMTPCPDGGTGCLTLAIVPNDGGDGFSFSPPPGRSGWRMCTGQTLVLESELDEPLCIDIRGMDGTRASIRSELPDESLWPDNSLGAGKYCVTVCEEQPDAGCSGGCKDDDCITRLPDTIRGNLDVISKPPEDLGNARDAGTP